MLAKIGRYCFSGQKLGPAKLFEQRRLLYQCTSDLLHQPHFIEKQQQKYPQQPLSVYCGYDPTAESLHLGNLVSIVMMARLQHLLQLRPIFLLGGATGLVGDPSGKKEERDLLAEERVNSNLRTISEEIRQVYAKVCMDLTSNSAQYDVPLAKTQHQPLFVNNHDFYANMNVLTYLRDIGKVLRMNSLLGKQIVANRIESEQGISYTEFSYSILQSYDFYQLQQRHGCVLQFGGSDQWGNITNGCDLIRRMTQGRAEGYGLTMPLLLAKNGEKFGKSAGNALYLSSSKTPTANLYDYLFSSADDQVEKLLSIFTFYSPSKIAEIMGRHREKPEQRLAQKILAEKVTSWLGGYRNVKQQLIKTSADKLKTKNSSQMKEIYDALPAQMKGQINLTLEQNVKSFPDLLVKLGLCKSRNEARRDIEGEGIYLNNGKIPKSYSQDPISSIVGGSLLQGEYMLVRRGKKNFYLLRVRT